MAKPAKSSLCQYAEHAGDSNPFKDFIVGDVLLPGDTQDSLDASPALTSIHESTENTSLIHCDLGVGRELGIFPHSSG